MKYKNQWEYQKHINFYTDNVNLISAEDRTYMCGSYASNDKILWKR